MRLFDMTHEQVAIMSLVTSWPCNNISGVMPTNVYAAPNSKAKKQRVRDTDRETKRSRSLFIKYTYSTYMDREIYFIYTNEHLQMDVQYDLFMMPQMF